MSRWKRFWCSLHGHTPQLVGVVSVLAHVRCPKCGEEWCHNFWSGNLYPWSKELESLFAEAQAVEEVKP